MSLVRFQNLYEAHTEQIEARDNSVTQAAATPPSDTNDTTTIQKSSQSNLQEPKVSWETNTPFGKFTISDATVSKLGNSLKGVVTNASYRVDAYKESLGMVPFKREEVDTLVRSGVLDGDQWLRAPESQLVHYKRNHYALYASLTFTAPTETYDLVRKSSAFNALMALIAIGGILGPVENTVEQVVSGALDGMFEDSSDLGRNFIERSLKRALLRTHAADKQSNPFQNFLLKRLQELPAPARDLCAKSEEDVRSLGIDDTQLSAIAEWAFASISPRTLVLWNKVEVMAALVVSSFFKNRRLALVDCEANSSKLFDSEQGSRGTPGLAIYYRGDAQRAIEILHRMNWLQPVMRVESKRASTHSPYLRLSCSIETSLNLCPGFLQSVGVNENDAIHLVNAIKKDAIEQFSRAVTISAEEQDSWSYTSQDNLQYFYKY